MSTASGQDIAIRTYMSSAFGVIHVLEKGLEEVLKMLDRVSEYVARVIVCFPPLG